ncbi:MAG: hypothetical protein E7284_10295 [Lachnospiraceae bacterium]|nr:hypothetical protein [Lachnospiraceae bacterium]
MESVITIGLSICTIIFTIILSIWEYRWNKKLYELKLKSDFVRKIFDDLIFERLLDASSIIVFNGTTISGTEELENVLKEIQQRLFIFRECNPKFYNGLLSEIKKLEKHLRDRPQPADTISFVQFYNKTNEYIKKIQGYITYTYLGKKIE